MALQKSIALNGSSVTASYWRLAGVKVDFLSNIAEVRVVGYVSKALRDSGDKHIMEKTIRWSGSENPITLARMVAGTAFAAAYAKLIAAETNPMMPLNPFEGATDVL